jgi:uncharacterized membrane protein
VEATDPMQEFLLFLHISTAILLIGGLSFMAMIMPGLVRAGAEGLPALRRLHQLGRVFGPSSAIVFLLGIALAINGEFEMGKPWLSISMLLFIVASLLGGAVSAKTVAAAIGHIESGQSTDAEASRLSLLGGINILIVLVIVWLMVDKPGL